MNRFRVHIHVDDLTKNLALHSKMFGTPPARVEPDDNKRMLEEPAVNFAISTRGHGHLGLGHLGIRVQGEADLAELKPQAQAAEPSLMDEGTTSCCCARSDKHWIMDPPGLPGEHFHTLGSVPTFRGAPDLGTASSASTAAAPSACCTSQELAPVESKSAKSAGCTPSPRAHCASTPIKSVGSVCC